MFHLVYEPCVRDDPREEKIAEHGRILFADAELREDINELPYESRRYIGDNKSPRKTVYIVPKPREQLWKDEQYDRAEHRNGEGDPHRY